MIKLKRDLPILGIITAVLLVIGAVFDMQISQAVYNPASNFGQFFNVFGELPAMIIGSFCALSLGVVARQRGKKGNWIVFIIFVIIGVFCAVSSAAMITDRAQNLSETASKVIMFTVTIGVSLASYYLAKAAAANNGEALYKAAVTGLWLFLIVTLAINLIKMGWGRERYRHMMEIGSTAGFSAWYLPQGLADGNEFMSFPSGHSANSAITLWLMLAPTFVPALKGKENIFKALAGVWIGLVMISRIIMGAHFLSDVTMGMAVSVLSFCIIYHCKYKKA